MIIGGQYLQGASAFSWGAGVGNGEEAPVLSPDVREGVGGGWSRIRRKRKDGTYYYEDADAGIAALPAAMPHVEIAPSQERRGRPRAVRERELFALRRRRH